MKPADIVVIAVIILIIGSAAFYIYKAKKNGKRCIGCPDSGSCSAAKCGRGCGSCGGCENN